MVPTVLRPGWVRCASPGGMAASLPRLRRGGSPTPPASTRRRQHSQMIPPTRRLAQKTVGMATSSQHEEEATVESEASRLGVTLDPIHEDFGTDVTGIDLKGGVSDEESELIKAALDRHHLLRFRNQEELDAEDEKQFMFQLPHLPEEELEGYCKNLGFETPPDYPWFAVRGTNVSYEDYLGLEIKAGNPPNAARTKKIWHMDFVYPKSPPEYTCMSMKISPSSGAGTEFFSAVKAYSRLTREQKEIVDGLRVKVMQPEVSMKIFSTPGNEDFLGDNGLGLWDYQKIRKVVDIDSEECSKAGSHPFVVRDPQTGEKAFLVNFLSFHKFEGMSWEESKALAEEMLAPAADRVWKADWRPNDVIIWKNRQLIHAVPPWASWECQSRLFHIAMWGGANPIKILEE